MRLIVYCQCPTFTAVPLLSFSSDVPLPPLPFVHYSLLLAVLRFSVPVMYLYPFLFDALVLLDTAPRPPLLCVVESGTVMVASMCAYRTSQPLLRLVVDSRPWREPPHGQEGSQLPGHRKIVIPFNVGEPAPLLVLAGLLYFQYHPPPSSPEPCGLRLAVPS